jgi:hypothetical protein
VAIYIKEAHPTDEWQMTSNEEQGVCYAQPKSLEDRVAIARDFVGKFAWPIPMLVDRVENRADELYAAWPERFYIVDEHGIITYKGAVGPDGYHPDEVEAWLGARFPDVGAAPR